MKGNITQRSVLRSMQSYLFCPLCAQPLKESFIDGRDRMFCPSCHWVHYVNPLPVAVAFTVNSNNELLVIRRAHEPALNEWALPGGFLEAGEHPEEGCLRELYEETSLEGTVDRLIGVYQRTIDMYGSLVVFAYRVVATHDNIAINHEVFEAGFYPPDRLPLSESHCTSRSSRRANGRQVSCTSSPHDAE
jgi:ADP-ribose pyrophosphatase YjhB (NUDIX family)